MSYRKAMVLIFGLLAFSCTNGQRMDTTLYSNPDCIVLQIFPGVSTNAVQIGGRSSNVIDAIVFLPNAKLGTHIAMKLSHLQEQCFLPDKIVKDIDGSIFHMKGIDSLKHVIITKQNDGVESIINISASVSKRIYQYFLLDIRHNEARYKSFDCYAFISLIRNVKYYPKNPSWQYEKTEPKVGDCVVLSKKGKMPEAIQHWALYLGDGLYISKFGQTGMGASSNVDIMNLEGMKYLYSCTEVYTAYPLPEAKPWSGFPQK